jgi:hypothetical protein
MILTDYSTIGILFNLVDASIHVEAIAGLDIHDLV